MFLLTALIVKNSHVMAEIYYIFLEKRLRPTIEGFSIPSLDIIGKIEKVVVK